MPSVERTKMADGMSSAYTAPMEERTSGWSTSHVLVVVDDARRLACATAHARARYRCMTIAFVAPRCRFTAVYLGLDVMRLSADGVAWAENLARAAVRALPPSIEAHHLVVIDEPQLMRLAESPDADAVVLDLSSRTRRRRFWRRWDATRGRRGDQPLLATPATAG